MVVGSNPTGPTFMHIQMAGFFVYDRGLVICRYGAILPSALQLPPGDARSIPSQERCVVAMFSCLTSILTWGPCCLLNIQFDKGSGISAAMHAFSLLLSLCLGR